MSKPQVGKIDFPHYQELFLRVISISDSIHIECEAMRRAGFEITLTHEHRNILMRMKSYFHGMAAETIEVHEQWPADWWQAFKERWFSGWMLKRWPVEYKKINISERRYQAVCPHLQNVPQDGHIQWMAEQQVNNYERWFD